MLNGLRLLIFAFLISSLAIANVGCRIWRPGKLSLSALESSQRSFREADAALKANNPEKAETLAKQAVQKNPRDEDAKALYAKILWDKGERKQALDILVPCAKSDDVSAELLIELSQMLLSINNLNDARYTIGKGTIKYPNIPVIWMIRARYYEKRGNVDQAIADMHRSLSLDPGQNDVRLELAEFYLKSNQPQRALETVQYALSQMSPGDEPLEAMLLEGRSYFALNRFSNAEQTFRLALQKSNDNPDIYFYVAYSEFQQNRFRDASRTAAAGLNLNPNHSGCRDILNQIELSNRNAAPIR